MAEPCPFQRASAGLTRFPPNVEQILVDHQPDGVWLIVRRNDDTVLRFPLEPADRLHLAALLLKDLE